MAASNDQTEDAIQTNALFTVQNQSELHNEDSGEEYDPLLDADAVVW